DDEVIGAGARIAAIAGTCTVFHLTDGAPTNRKFFPEVASSLSRAAYARMRREEAVRARAAAGRDASRRAGLGARDPEVAVERVPAAERLAAALFEQHPEIVVTHAYEGGHPDHDAAAFAVHAAKALARAQGLATEVTVAEMTSYHDRGGLTMRGEFLPSES